MNLLTQLLAQGVGGQGQKKPQASGGRSRPSYTPPQRLMQVNPDGSHGLSNQGYLPPELQQDTWLSNDPTAMQPPIQYPRMNPQTGYRSMAPGQESIDLARGPQGNMSVYREPGINSISGRAGDYGGTAGFDNGRPFANMNYQGQPTDPLAELRRFLGL